VIGYENTTVGVDSFAITWTDSLPVIAAYAVAGANDMDHDGKPEFVIGGSRIVGGGRKFIYYLFETTGDDSYEPVWACSSLTGGVFDYHHVATGDVDGDSIDEMVFGLDGYGICLYKCIGPDSYDGIWQWRTQQYICHILIYDLNRNGYGEIVVNAENGTWIFEKELPGVEEANDQLSMTNVQLMQNYPNPFRSHTTVPYCLPSAVGRPRTADDLSTYQLINLSVYDASGRLVRVLVDGDQEPGMYSVSWDGKDGAGRPVPTGVYLYRLGGGDFTATRNLMVVR